VAAPGVATPVAPPYADKLSEPKSGSGMRWAATVGVLAVAGTIGAILWNREPSKPLAEETGEPAKPVPSTPAPQSGSVAQPPKDGPASDLRPYEPPPTTVPKPKPPDTVSRPAPPAPEPDEPAPSALIPFQVTTQPPGAEVTFDNDSANPCKSPCTVNLPKGRHSLLARLPGHRDSLRIFEIPHDTGLIIDMIPMTGMLQITSTPPGLLVQVDGKDQGKTPLTLKLSAGVHKVLVSKDGQTREFTVRIRDEGMSSQHIDWQ
jgi:hypothetical protein